MNEHTATISVNVKDKSDISQYVYEVANFTPIASSDLDTLRYLSNSKSLFPFLFLLWKRYCATKLYTVPNAFGYAVSSLKILREGNNFFSKLKPLRELFRSFPKKKWMICFFAGTPPKPWLRSRYYWWQLFTKKHLQLPLWSTVKKWSSVLWYWMKSRIAYWRCKFYFACVFVYF